MQCMTTEFILKNWLVVNHCHVNKLPKEIPSTRKKVCLQSIIHMWKITHTIFRENKIWISCNTDRILPSSSEVGSSCHAFLGSLLLKLCTLLLKLSMALWARDWWDEEWLLEFVCVSSFWPLFGGCCCWPAVTEFGVVAIGNLGLRPPLWLCTLEPMLDVSGEASLAIGLKKKTNKIIISFSKGGGEYLYYPEIIWKKLHLPRATLVGLICCRDSHRF